MSSTLTPIVNPSDIRALCKLDPVFTSVHSQFGSPPSWSRPVGFVSMVMIILEQQVSLASAKAHFEKLNQYVGEITPVNLLRLSDEEMRDCHISRQKSRYLRELSRAVINGQVDLDLLVIDDDQAYRSSLTAIKGIGTWTSDIYLMFCLQRKDIFPIGDIAVCHAVRALTGVASREEIERKAATWQPYRSLASYFCWHYYLSVKAARKK